MVSPLIEVIKMGNKNKTKHWMWCKNKSKFSFHLHFSPWFYEIDANDFVLIDSKLFALHIDSDRKVMIFYWKSKIHLKLKILSKNLTRDGVLLFNISFSYIIANQIILITSTLRRLLNYCISLNAGYHIAYRTIKSQIITKMSHWIIKYYIETRFHVLHGFNVC